MFLNRKKLHIWEFFTTYLFYLQPEEEEVEEEPMSEESDVDLDMEGVVEVIPIIYIYLECFLGCAELLTDF